MDRWERNERRFNWFFGAVSVFIAFVFMLVIGLWIAYAVAAVKLAHEIDEHGLKSIIEQVWEGRDGGS